MNEFIKFLLQVPEQSLIWYLTFDTLIHKHYHSEWECDRLSEIHLNRYITLKNEIYDRFRI